jgi:hypothetical protein
LITASLPFAGALAAPRRAASAATAIATPKMLP